MNLELRKYICARFDLIDKSFEEVIQKLHFAPSEQENEIDELLELVKEAHDQCQGIQNYLTCIN
jgi:hypothetical protein